MTLKFGYITSRIDDTRPECILCDEILCNDAIKPSKLKRHQETKHASCLTQDLRYFERQKRLYLDNRPATIKSASSRHNSDLEKATEAGWLNKSDWNKSDFNFRLTGIGPTGISPTKFPYLNRSDWNKSDQIFALLE